MPAWRRCWNSVEALGLPHRSVIGKLSHWMACLSGSVYTSVDNFEWSFLLLSRQFITARHPKWFKCYCSMQACLSSPSSSSSSSSSFFCFCVCQGWVWMEWSAFFHSSSSACLQLLVLHAEEEEDEEEDHKLWPAECGKCHCSTLFSFTDVIAWDLIEACNTLSFFLQAQMQGRYWFSCTAAFKYKVADKSLNNNLSFILLSIIEVVCGCRACWGASKPASGALLHLHCGQLWVCLLLVLLPGDPLHSNAHPGHHWNVNSP